MANDFSKLSEMVYSGRGISLGMTPDGNPFVGYTLTGRSPSSQARRLVYDESDFTVRTEVTDLEQLKKGNPALLIYPAIALVGEHIGASNGTQTNLIRDRLFLKDDSSFPVEILIDAMNKPVDLDGIDITTYEPDAPNNTPRICGCVDEVYGGFYIVRRADNGNAGIVSHHHIKLVPGAAHVLTTYKGGNETPLAPFIGAPLEARIDSLTSDKICESLYDAIGPKGDNNYRVAAAVMMTRDGEVDFSIINRSERGE